MSHYSAYKYLDLRRMLKQRGLQTIGVKAKLVSRLISYDLEHPFPFQNLPAEIRNEIYRYVASAATEHIKDEPGPRSQEAVTCRERCEMAHRTSTPPPALFNTCWQIRNEGRGIFYRYHTFKLHVRQEYKDRGSHSYVWPFELKFATSSCDYVMKWMDTIGVYARSQIRNLEIEICWDKYLDLQVFARFIRGLHAKLSDEATVVYRIQPLTFDALNLWDLGKVFYECDPLRVPLLENLGWAGSSDQWAWAGNSDPWT